MEIIGEIRFFSVETLPDAQVFMRCDGTQLDKTVHSALFNLIGYGFSADSFGNLFSLPNITPIMHNDGVTPAAVPYITVKGIYPNADGLVKITNSLRTTTNYTNSILTV
jgi:microcystin-dependent protein